LETSGVAATLILTALADGAQPGLEIVHTRVEVLPIVKPVTGELKSVGVVTTALPANTVQSPVPGAGLLPLRVVVVTLHKF
jgi:hypothetical protein